MRINYDEAFNVNDAMYHEDFLSTPHEFFWT